MVSFVTQCFRRGRSDNPNDSQPSYVSIVKVELPSKEAAAAESLRLKRSEFPDVSIRESEGM